MFNAFSLILALGAGFGLLHVTRVTSEATARRWLLAGLLMLLAGLLGARLGYTWLHSHYFDAHPMQIFQFWLGGLWWPGAAAGCALAALLLALALRVPLSLVVDRLAGMAFPVAVAAWIGSWTAGTAYGAAVSPTAWYALTVVDETGAAAARWPLQLVAAAVLLFAYLLLPRSRPGRVLPSGQAGWSALMVLGLILLIFSLLVKTPGPRWNEQRPETWVALGVALVATLALSGVRAPRHEQTYARPVTTEEEGDL